MTPRFPLVFVTGGARGDKSSFAERHAAASGQGVTYLATAQAFDAEMEIPSPVTAPTARLGHGRGTPQRPWGPA